MAYDAKCYELAEDFLEEEPDIDTEKNRALLAQLIQDAIDNFMYTE